MKLEAVSSSKCNMMKGTKLRTLIVGREEGRDARSTKNFSEFITGRGTSFGGASDRKPGVESRD